MNIRILDKNDAEKLRRTRLFALQESPEAFGASFDREVQISVEEVGERLSAPNGIKVIGAFDGSDLVGIVGLGREQHAKLAHKATLSSMYVLPKYRSNGVARRLVGAAIQQAGELGGIKQINLTVNVANAPAISLYKKLGFSEFGREPNGLCIEGKMYDELHMYLMLASS